MDGRPPSVGLLTRARVYKEGLIQGYVPPLLTHRGRHKRLPPRHFRRLNPGYPRSHRQNARLGWIDDRREGSDPEHTKVRDGEGSALELFWLQFSVPRTGGEIFHHSVDVAQTALGGGGGR